MMMRFVSSREQFQDCVDFFKALVSHFIIPHDHTREIPSAES